ncbi:hypothetical protein OF83DRAFT_1100610 [Amylostereum chailletii]|nr:hypothetical protein OF83DRAFT_1100610 [Amylostereum chailletii]
MGGSKVESRSRVAAKPEESRHPAHSIVQWSSSSQHVLYVRPRVRRLFESRIVKPGETASCKHGPPPRRHKR